MGLSIKATIYESEHKVCEVTVALKPNVTVCDVLDAIAEVNDQLRHEYLQERASVQPSMVQS